MLQDDQDEVDHVPLYALFVVLERFWQLTLHAELGMLVQDTILVDESHAVIHAVLRCTLDELDDVGDVFTAALFESSGALDLLQVHLHLVAVFLWHHVYSPFDIFEQVFSWAQSIDRSKRFK